MKTKEQASKERFPEGTMTHALHRKHFENGWQQCMEQLAIEAVKVISPNPDVIKSACEHLHLTCHLGEFYECDNCETKIQMQTVL